MSKTFTNKEIFETTKKGWGKRAHGRIEMYDMMGTKGKLHVPSHSSILRSAKTRVANARAYKLMKGLTDRAITSKQGNRRIAVGRISKISAAYPRAAKRLGKGY